MEEVEEYIADTNTNPDILNQVDIEHKQIHESQNQHLGLFSFSSTNHD